MRTRQGYGGKLPCQLRKFGSEVSFDHDLGLAQRAANLRSYFLLAALNRIPES